MSMVVVGPQSSLSSILPPNLHLSNHRRRKKLNSGGKIKASWQELAGVLVFSAVPFTAVKLIANSPLGEKLQQRLLEKKKDAVRNSINRLALADQARRDRLLILQKQNSVGMEKNGPVGLVLYLLNTLHISLDNFQEIMVLILLVWPWILPICRNTTTLGVIIPEVLNLVGAFHFVEPVWWRVGYSKLKGDTLDYLGIPGFHLAGSQGVIVIAVCQFLLMVGPEYARYCGIEALEPLGIYLPGDINYPGGLLFDPLNLSEDPTGFEELKIKEIKNGRLAMVAWLGFYVQAIVTQKGPVENLIDHISDPLHNNILSYLIPSK